MRIKTYLRLKKRYSRPSHLTNLTNNNYMVMISIFTIVFCFFSHFNLFFFTLSIIPCFTMLNLCIFLLFCHVSASMSLIFSSFLFIFFITLFCIRNTKSLYLISWVVSLIYTYSIINFIEKLLIRMCEQ